MKIIVGLGNPGARYAQTRHNVGWMVLDALADRLRTEFQPGRGDYYAAPGSWRGRKVVLVKPTTFMNNSGTAVRQVIKHYGGTPADVLIVVDEIQFPVGRIKLNASGSSGGHNGIDSVIRQLGTDAFPRLRCGVGNDFGPGQMVDFVLSGFSAEEELALADMVQAGKDAALQWLVEGTARAMNRVNARKSVQGSRDTAAKADSDSDTVAL